MSMIRVTIVIDELVKKQAMRKSKAAGLSFQHFVGTCIEKYGDDVIGEYKENRLLEYHKEDILEVISTLKRIINQ